LAHLRKADGMTPFELSGARALGIALENTKIHCTEHNCLETTQDKVDTFVQSKLNELDSYVEALEQRTVLLLTMETSAHVYVSSLFFATNYLPMLETIEPKQIDLRQKSIKVEVRFLGNFSCASHRYPPTLNFNNNNVVIEASRIDPHCLRFLIDVDQANPDGNVFISGILTVPRKTGWCCWSKMVKSHFNVWIGNFPEIPEVKLENFSYTVPNEHNSSGSEEVNVNIF